MEHSTIQTLTDLYKYIPPVEIDEGTFKYIQIKGKSASTGEKIIFIRGYSRCPYHADILDEFLSDLKKIQSIQPILIKGKDGKEVEIVSDVSFSSPGGGRIEHSVKDHKIFVYGYSQSFGQANHNTTCKMLRERYPEYPESNITWSNEGY